jgi:hypothetical protein
MFVLYLLAEDSREFEILTRPTRLRPATMYSNESVWMVPGTVSADEENSSDLFSGSSWEGWTPCERRRRGPCGAYAPDTVSADD